MNRSKTISFAFLVTSACLAGSASAQITTFANGACGDGVLDAPAGENCDDQNNVSGDGCSSLCQVEPLWSCSQSNLVLNGDFEGGNAGFTSMLQSDPTGVQKAVCGGSRRAPGADKYRVSNVPALVCGCLGGSGSCIETWSSLDKTLWSQSVPVIAGRSYKATFAFMADQKFPGGCAPTSSDCQPGLNLMAAGLKIKGVIGGPPTTNSYLGSPVSSWRLSGGSAFRPNKSGSIDLAFLVRGNGGYVILDSISLVGPSECSSPPVCGNGRIDPGEKCDDQNRREGDGCNASCQVESGWSCTGAPTRCVRTQAPTSSEVQ